MSTHVLTADLFVPLPRERVFAFFSDAENLERITPPELKFRILTPRPVPIHANAVIDYRLSLHGMPFEWQTLITVWEPPTRFVDTQARGPYATWVHTHTFEEADGGTWIRDRVEYALPLAPLSIVALPIVKKQLRRIFTFRQEACVRGLGLEPSAARGSLSV